jgi:starch-binding outer membrane protein, SusD/RagB family
MQIFNPTIMKIKHKSFLRIFALSLLVTACSPDFLEVKPQGQINAENYFQTADHAIWATNAVYNQLRTWDVIAFPLIAMTDIISDDATKGSFPADGARLTTFEDFTFGPSFPEEIRLAWRGYYQGIFRANTAIEGIQRVAMNEQLKNRLIGESKFLRAHYYFYLVRWFGDIPLITRPLLESEYYNQPRAPKAEVYNLIIQDLKDAIAVLPEKSQYPSTDMGRATKGAARGVLAKVYLTMGDFVNAEQYALEVIQSGQYALFPQYNRIFLPEGENSSESVFEIQATALEGSYNGATAWNMIQGVRGTPNLGWGFNNPSSDLIAAYESGDPRRDATILYVGEVLPDGSAIVQDNPDMLNERYNQKAWTPRHPGLQDNGPSNIRILRYADVLLIAAEALNENNKPSDALVYINLVRDRARGNRPMSVLPRLTITDKNQLRQAIWRERRVELAMEQQRWFDLIRTGQAAEKLSSSGFVTGKHELMPIPQSEIDLSAGTLTQNPGY